MFNQVKKRKVKVAYPINVNLVFLIKGGLDTRQSLHGFTSQFTNAAEQIESNRDLFNTHLLMSRHLATGKALVFGDGRGTSVFMDL